MFELHSEEGELTCKVMVREHLVRDLIDTGSVISILNSRELKRLEMDEAQPKPGNIDVSQADGSEKEILGMVDLVVRLSNLETVHRIYISPSLGRELII